MIYFVRNKVLNNFRVSVLLKLFIIINYYCYLFLF